MSPIDLIPDFVPVLGYLDDLLLIPLGLLLVIRLTPPAVLAECRAQAETLLERPRSRPAAACIMLLWVACAAGLAFWSWPSNRAGSSAKMKPWRARSRYSERLRMWARAW